MNYFGKGITDTDSCIELGFQRGPKASKQTGPLPPRGGIGCVVTSSRGYQGMALAPFHQEAWPLGGACIYAMFLPLPWIAQLAYSTLTKCTHVDLA